MPESWGGGGAQAVLAPCAWGPFYRHVTRCHCLCSVDRCVSSAQCGLPGVSGSGSSPAWMDPTPPFMDLSLVGGQSRRQTRTDRHTEPSGTKHGPVNAAGPGGGLCGEMQSGRGH